MCGSRDQEPSKSMKSNLSSMFRSSWPGAALTLIAGLILVDPAFGQMVEEGVRQDNVERLESARPILEYIIAGVCIFGALAIGFKSSNRAHGT